MFSHPEDEGVEQQQHLQTEDHRFSFHPPGSHNPTDQHQDSLSLWVSLVSLPPLVLGLFLPLSLKSSIINKTQK